MSKNKFIHQTADVSKGAKIGENTKIWNNSQVREGAVIGKNCILGKDTYIDKNVIIGDSVKIQNGVSIFDGVIVSDNAFIGPNVVFTNDKFPRAFIKDWKKRNTYIKHGASVGGNTTIVCGNTIGEYSMIGAGTVIAKDVPKHALVIGNPAKIVGFVCCCGKKLSEIRLQDEKVESNCENCNKEVVIDTSVYKSFLQQNSNG